MPSERNTTSQHRDENKRSHTHPAAGAGHGQSGAPSPNPLDLGLVAAPGSAFGNGLTALRPASPHSEHQGLGVGGQASAGSTALRRSTADTARGRSAGVPAPAGVPAVLRRRWDPRTYKVSDQERTMSVENSDPVVVNGAEPIPNDQHPRAFLYETIGTPTNLPAFLDRARDLSPAAWPDVGVSVVLNTAWTPPTQYTQDGQKTRTPKTKGRTQKEAQDHLNEQRTALVRAWNGPSLEIMTAAWERREVDGNLEQVQGSVPYTTLRLLAATNPGAQRIEGALSRTHDHVWHKMGDDDMPVQEPNPARNASDEITKLQVAEVADAAVRNRVTMVTFGYNLVTDNVIRAVQWALERIYTKEMQLRDHIHSLHAPIYPSEPTTYYLTTNPETTELMWKNVESQKTGGSGQQLEGARLLLSLNEATKGSPPSTSGKQNQSSAKQGGAKSKNNSAPQASSSDSGKKAEKLAVRQYAYHTIRVDTSAGGRNDRIAELLSGWWNGGDPASIVDQQLETAINGLDQCALKDGEYLGKVFSKVPRLHVGEYKLEDQKIYENIERSIREARQNVVATICDRYRRDLTAAKERAKKGSETDKSKSDPGLPPPGEGGNPGNGIAVQ